MNLLRRVLQKVRPWSSSRTEYRYTRALQQSSPLKVPSKLTTDCSGFVSWVVQQGCWTRVNKLTDARPGDIFVYAITREKAGCGSGGSDSGHVMFVMGAPFEIPHPSPASCSRGYTRYKM